MDAPKVPMSLKERLLQYQENAKKQKAYDRKHNLSVSQLDSSMTDVSKYSRASSLTNRKATTVSADMVNRLDPNILEDFNGSASLDTSAGSISFLQSPVRGYQSPMKGFRSPMREFRSPVMAKLDLSGGSAELKMDDEPEARGLFLKALATTTGEEVKHLEEDQKVNFSDLRSRYLRSIFSLMPSYEHISHLSKKKRFSIFREDAHKREEYVNIRDAWDKYEQKAHDRPYEPTTEDEAIETEIKDTEREISTQWTNLAKQVVDDILNDDEETEAEEGDDDLLVCVEAARQMAKENELRQKNKHRAEMKRRTLYLEDKLKEEDPELLKEALRLRDESAKRSQYNSASTFSLTLSSEDRTENSEWDSRWEEEARRQRLADQSRKVASEDGNYEDYEEGSEEDIHVIDQGKKLRRAYIRHLANQKDSDSEPEEDEEVDNIPKWISEARELKYLSRSQQRMSLRGSSSNLVMDTSKFVDENGSESDAEDEERKLGHDLDKVKKFVDNSESSDSDDSRSVYLWREEARRMKEEERAKGDKEDAGAEVGYGYKTEDSESSFYDDVVRKAMELEKKYRQRRATVTNEDSSSSSEDDLDRSRWLNEARELKAKGRCIVDDPEKQAWLDEAKRLREEANAGRTGMQDGDCDTNADDNDEEIALKALNMCKDYEKGSSDSATETHSKEEIISRWVQEARKHETEKRKIFGNSGVWLEEARRLRAEALAKKAAEQDPGVLTVGKDDEESENSEDIDVKIVRKAKNLRREYIRERLKYGYNSESDEDNDDVDDLSRWIEAARAARERQRSKEKPKGHRSSRKKWYEDSELDSSDEEIDEAKRAVFLEEAKRLRANSISNGAHSLPGESGDHPPNKVSDGEISKKHVGIYDDVVRKAMALEKKYKERRAAREKKNYEVDDSEDPAPSWWIQEAQKLKAESD